MTSQPLTTVATFRFLPEAEAVRWHLQESGILAFLADAEVVNMDWFLGVAVGYIKLQVPTNQAENALRLVDYWCERKITLATDDAEDSCCLRCGQSIAESESACRACGWSYVQSEDAE